MMLFSKQYKDKKVPKNMFDYIDVSKNYTGNHYVTKTQGLKLMTTVMFSKLLIESNLFTRKMIELFLSTAKRKTRFECFK